MSVVQSIEDLGSSRTKLRVEVPQPAVEAETQRVAASYRQQARLPGFRRGKVPMELVRKRWAGEIEQDVIEHLLPRFLHQAVGEKELDPLGPPEVSDVDLVEGEGLSFTAVIEVRPEIELRDLDAFELPDPAVEPTDDEVSEALEDLRRQVADWVPADRPAARGDRIRGRLAPVDTETAAEGSEDDDAEAPGAAGEADDGAAGQADETPGQQVVFEVGAEDVWEELGLAAIGLTRGGSTEFGRSEPGEDGALGPERRFRLVVEEVEERDLPALDDDFASKLGEFDDLAALEADIRERLAVAKRRERRRTREQALLDQLRDRHPLALPPRVVEREVETMMRDYAESLARRGIDPERAGLDWNAIGGQLRPQAEKRVHARLLLDAVSEVEGVELGADQFEASLARLARAQGRSTPALRKALADAGTLDELKRRLTREKTILHLMNEDSEEADLVGASPGDGG